MATIAFGMGVNCPDVCQEAYVQETRRASHAISINSVHQANKTIREKYVGIHVKQRIFPKKYDFQQYICTSCTTKYLCCDICVLVINVMRIVNHLLEISSAENVVLLHI